MLPVILFFALLAFEDWISHPYCKTMPGRDPDDHVGPEQESEDDLKVMLVANLLLFGSEAGFVNLYFRDYYMSKFFKKSFHRVKPDLLLVLGDISAKGSQLTKTKWLSVFHQFHWMLGPFLGLPYHVVLGDRDFGECGELDAKFVNWITRKFPGLDSSGCGAFKISNVSFVSLNSVALLCGNNELRFSAEKAIESESLGLQMKANDASKTNEDSSKLRTKSHDFGWRENAISSGAGPVLLLHFPLHQTRKGSYGEGNAFNGALTPPHQSSRTQRMGFSDTSPYELSCTVPPNATEYIFQALRPRIIFSAHAYEFYDYVHFDGTREITVPAMTWKARDDPGFVVATFRRNRSVVSVSYCSLARESHVLLAYSTFLVILLMIPLLASTPKFRSLRW